MVPVVVHLVRAYMGIYAWVLQSREASRVNNVDGTSCNMSFRMS